MRSFAVLLAMLTVALVPAADAARKHARLTLAASTTLTVHEQTSAAVTFHVAAPDEPLPYSLWVATVCRDAAGVAVSAAYLPVVWAVAGTDGFAGSFRTDGVSPVAGPVVSCAAFVWVFPDAWTPVSNTVTVEA